MARDGITYEQVAVAADTLQGAGITPTIAGIRERLGTGSPNTIHRHLAAWRAARPAVATVDVAPSAGLAAAFAAEVEQRAAAIKAEVEAQLAQAQADLLELRTAADRLQAERDEQAEAIRQMTSERDTLCGQLEQQAGQIAHERAEAREAMAAARKAVADAARAEARLEALPDLRREVEQLREALEAERAGRHRAELEAASQRRAAGQ